MLVVINLLIPSPIFYSVLGNAALRGPENLLAPLVGFGMVAVVIMVARMFSHLGGLHTEPERRALAFLAGL